MDSVTADKTNNTGMSSSDHGHGVSNVTTTVTFSSSFSFIVTISATTTVTTPLITSFSNLEIPTSSASFTFASQHSMVPPKPPLSTLADAHHRGQQQQLALLELIVERLLATGRPTAVLEQKLGELERLVMDVDWRRATNDENSLFGATRLAAWQLKLARWWAEYAQLIHEEHQHQQQQTSSGAATISNHHHHRHHLDHHFGIDMDSLSAAELLLTDSLPTKWSLAVDRLFTESAEDLLRSSSSSRNNNNKQQQNIVSQTPPVTTANFEQEQEKRNRRRTAAALAYILFIPEYAPDAHHRRGPPPPPPEIIAKSTTTATLNNSNNNKSKNNASSSKKNYRKIELSSFASKEEKKKRKEKRKHPIRFANAYITDIAALKSLLQLLTNANHQAAPFRYNAHLAQELFEAAFTRLCPALQGRFTTRYPFPGQAMLHTLNRFLRDLIVEHYSRVKQQKQVERLMSPRTPSSASFSSKFSSPSSTTSSSQGRGSYASALCVTPKQQQAQQPSSSTSTISTDPVAFPPLPPAHIPFCRYCKEGGHRLEQCAALAGTLCFRCNGFGHSAGKCPEKKKQQQQQGSVWGGNCNNNSSSFSSSKK
ncbi:hypothetical protein TYRP_007081 [Tyrophagus putrescentiae]|nr:hypothetical protein TYRP_007081 [Tyrophagus putrescentiae]